MRTAMMSAGFLLAGAMLMNATVDGQDKKDEKVDPKWPDKVAVRRWDAQGKQFLPEIKDVKAKYKELGKEDKTPVWQLRTANLPAPTAGTEITDKDGVVWVTTKVVHNDEYSTCYVTKKPAPKPD